ncbi:T9SS type A sorting domain-containing protein [bacterium]|nr:T9SS type A sorting domain-containing protein [bacterium]
MKNNDVPVYAISVQNEPDYSVTVDVLHLTNGIYFCKLKVHNQTHTKKMILMK